MLLRSLNTGVIFVIFLSLFTYGQTGRKSGCYNYPAVHQLAEEYFHQRSFDSAVFYYRKLLFQPEYSDSHAILLKEQCLLRIANAYMSDGNIDSAQSYIEKIIFNNEGSTRAPPQQLREYYFIKGHLQYLFSQADSANFFLNKALYYCDSTQSDSLYTLIIKDLGNVEFLQHHYDSALIYYEKALDFEKGRQHPSELTISSLYQNMSIIYAKRFEYNNADRYFKTSLDIKEKLLMNDDILLINAYINYSLLLTEIGEFQKALDFSNLAEHLVLSKFNKDHYLLGHIYHEKSVILENLGKNNAALMYAEKAFNQFSKKILKNQPAIDKINWNMGLYYFKTKNYVKALYYLEKIKRFDNDPRTQILTNILSAKCFENIGQYENADSNFLMSINLIQKNSFENSIVGVVFYNAYGNFLAKKGFIDDAEANLIRAINICLEDKYSRDNLVGSMNNLAFLYLSNNNVIDALKFFHFGLFEYYDYLSDTSYYYNPRSFQYNKTSNVQLSLQGKSLALLKYYSSISKDTMDLKACINTTKLALDLYNRVQAYSSSNESSFILTDNASAIIDAALNANYEMYTISKSKQYLMQANDFLEKYKASNLRTSIQVTEAIHFSKVPAEYVAKENNLKCLINYYDQKIENLEYYSGKIDSLKIIQNKDLRFEALVRYDSLINFLEYRYPDYYNLKYENSSISVEKIQSKLTPQAAMINYALTDTNVYISLITTEDVFLTRSKIDENFQSDVINYYRLIKKGGEKSQIKSLSQYLYSELIAPIEEHIKDKEDLIIIPDNCLHYIPFETLCNPKTSNQDKKSFSSQHYLINDFAISYHYSATLWEKGRFTGHSNSDSALQSVSFIGYAPSFEDTDTISTTTSKPIIDSNSTDDNEYRTIEIYGRPYGELPYSKKEVETITRLFRSYGYDAKSVLSNDASEVHFKKHAENYDIIHIATHAFSNDENPQLSGMVFHQPEDFINSGLLTNSSLFHGQDIYDDNNEGILHAGEMYNLNISADLMVLSACETGVGKIVKGEGMIAMTRGLIYSGVKNIVFTLWNISDKHTQNFMVDFYQEVLNGASYTQALRKAKLNMINNEPTSYPKLWSGYMLIGQ